MRKSFQGFTVLELIVVAVIIGILAVLGLASFTAPKELALEREAQGNLKLIADAEKMYRLETGAYVNSSNTTNINSNLRLMLPTGDTNWRYNITNASSIIFLARAFRTSGPYNGTKCFSINETSENTTNCPP